MTHTNNGREFWLQVVPDDASADLMTIKDGNIFIAETCSLVWCGNPPEPSHEEWGTICEAILPSGTWAIHSDSSTITEEHATQLVEKVHIRTPEEWAYRNYTEGFKLNEIGVTIGYSFAIGSFESLLRSLNINQRVIILEKLC
jgi:hypothetical protein